MEKLNSYKVELKAMPGDTVSYQWHVDDDFFSAVQGPEIQQGQLDVALRVKQTAEVYVLDFRFSGTVKVECDRCLELFDFPIQAERTLRVKLGDKFEDDGDMVTVPSDDGTFCVAWNLYEFIALEIPMRHVHPEGECLYDESVLEQKNMDPRWSELKKILDNTKK